MRKDERAAIYAIYRRVVIWRREMRKTRPKLTPFQLRCLKIAIERGLCER